MPTKATLEAENRRLLELLQERGDEGDPEPDPRELPEEFHKDAEPADFDGDVDLFLEEATTPGDDRYVDSYRYDEKKAGGDGKLKFVYRWEFADFNLAVVKEHFGGGRWHFRLKKASGSMIRSKTTHIEGARREPKEAADDPRGFAETVMDTQALILETLQEVRKGPPAGTTAADPINMALSLVGAFDAIIAPQREALQALMMRKDNGGDGGGFSEMFKIFQLGMETGQGSSAPASDPMGQVLATTLPPLLKMIGEGQARPPVPEAMLPNPPPEAGPAGPLPRPGARPAWDVLLSSQLPQILGWARANKNPDTLAAYVVEAMPPEAESLILAQLRRGPEFFREFMLLHPEAKPWEVWLADFWMSVADQWDWGADDLGPHPFRDTPPEELGPNPEEGRAEITTPRAEEAPE